MTSDFCIKRVDQLQTYLLLDYIVTGKFIKKYIRKLNNIDVRKAPKFSKYIAKKV